MKPCHTLIVGIILTLVIFVSRSGFAAATATDPPKEGKAAVTAAAPTDPDCVPKKTRKAAKRNKVRKKRTAAKTTPSNAEIVPGEQMTLKQVLDILKTTRDLSGRNLSGLQLVGANLVRCNLKGADLRHANLERADLAEANLERADLTDANLKMASLKLSGMAGTALDHTILDGALWQDGRLCAAGSLGACK